MATTLNKPITREVDILGEEPPPGELIKINLARLLSVELLEAHVKLPKISSKIAKFHLQIVENRLKFQSKSYREWIASSASSICAA